MTARFEDIDLNSDVASAVLNDEVPGVNASESTVRASDPAAETLTNLPLGVGLADGGLGASERVNGPEEGLGLIGRDSDARMADKSSGGEIEANDGTVDIDLKGIVQNTDACLGKSKCSKQNEGLGEVFSACSGGGVSNRKGESVSARDEVEGEKGIAENAGHCAETGDDGFAGLGSVEEKLKMGAGGAVDSELVYEQSNIIPSEVASGPLHGGVVKPDRQPGGSSHLGTGDGDRNSGFGIDNYGAEAKGDASPLVDDTSTQSDGFGLNGCQDAMGEARTRDILPAVGIKKENDMEAAFRVSKVNKLRIEKEGLYYASDLVWGKVRSHPWWPGQIFDPSDASEKARRYFKKDGLLIAYFGDQTFAWNEASKIKPFRKHFSQMEDQSNSEGFSHAVDCALAEVSRRVENGLACSCLSEELYNKIKTQVIVNAGISEESSTRDGSDEFSSVTSFMPVDLVQYLNALARSPYDGTNRLEFVITRAQLSAFYRWKGFYELPDFKMRGSSLEDDADIPVMGPREYLGGKNKDAVGAPRGRKSVIQDSFSRKRKEISDDGFSTSKKERRVSDLMSMSHSNLSNGKGEPKGKSATTLNSSSSKKRKADDSMSDDSRMKSKSTSLSPVTKKQFSRVGESIQKVAGQLALQSPALKGGSKFAKGRNESSKRPSRTRLEKSQREKVIPAECPPSDEMLSELYMAARDPTEGYNMISSFRLFYDFRDSFCLKNSASQEHKKSVRKFSDRELSNTETTETSGFEGNEDSYWTDRIVESNIEEQLLFEPEILDNNITPAVEPEAANESGQRLDSEQETALVNSKLDGKPADKMDDKCEEEPTPTALIMNFADLESVPSQSVLNKIFSHYGPLCESDTEVREKSKRAKVVFKRRADAETAFSSTGKFSIFGPSLVSYRLHFSLSSPRKTSTSATKRNRKSVTSRGGNAV